MYQDLAEKVALVTGSSSGIGEQTVYLLSKSGAKVVVTGRDTIKVNNVAAKCQDLSPKKYKPVTLVCDLEKEKDVAALYEITLKQYNRIDILVNNAGGAKMASIMDDHFLEYFDQAMNLHCRGVLQLTRLAIPSLIQNKGCIINVSSVLSVKQEPLLCHYGMSKAAMDKMTRHLALDLGPKGVRVNCISPGVVKTSLYNRLGWDDTAYELIGKGVPLERYGKPEEVAELIAFLASEKASFITGSIIPVDGGALCKN